MILHTCKDKNNLHRHFNHYTDKKYTLSIKTFIHTLTI